MHNKHTYSQKGILMYTYSRFRASVLVILNNKVPSNLNLSRLTGEILARCKARAKTKEALSRLNPTLVLTSTVTQHGTTESSLFFPLLRYSF